MKVSTTIFKSKKLSNGEYPIAIRVFHNKKTKYYFVGISTKIENWNENSNKVRSTDKSYRDKNEIIITAERTVQFRIGEFEKSEFDYDLDIICGKEVFDIQSIKSVKPPKPKSIYDIIELKKQTVSENTAWTYIALRNILNRYYGKKDIDINDIDAEFFDGFVRKIKNDDKIKSISYQKKYITSLKSVYTFAFKRGYLDKFINLEYDSKRYKTIPTNRALSTDMMISLSNKYQKLLIGNKLNVYKNSELTSLHLWLTMLITGMANVDIAKMRVKDLIIKNITTNNNPNKHVNIDGMYSVNINETKCYQIKGTRSKSGTPYNIVLDFNKSNYLFEPYLTDENGNTKKSSDYLFPIFDGTETEKQKSKRISNHFFKKNIYLNKAIHDKSFSTDKNLKPLFDEDYRITYYSARHTLITQLRMSGNIPDAVIMQLTGKQSVGGLDIYTSTNEDNKILEATNKIFDMLA